MIRIVEHKDKIQFNKLAFHPLQSWEWGEFRLKTGIEVLRLGRYVKDKLTETAQITIHPLPVASLTIGYFPKGNIPSGEMLEELMELGKKKNAVMIKLEPHVEKSQFHLKHHRLKPSPYPLFTRFTFQLDLSTSEDQLLSKMHHKTRYNIRLAQKKGVFVVEDNSDEAFETYLKLLKATTIRQKFFAHTEKYNRLMWETMKGAGMAHLLTAKYKTGEGREETLAAWVLFLFNNVLYYPYGASANLYRQYMPSNLMMWEAIRFGKKNGAEVFDMWGALGPDPDPTDPWYGFHKFKEGYGPVLTELIGSFDLVVNPVAYPLFNGFHLAREIFLKIKMSLRR